MKNRSKLNCNLYSLRLLLQTSKLQAIAILETITKSQTDCVSEIILNLTLGNIVDLDENLQKQIRKSRRILNSLKNRNLSVGKRGTIIKNHPKIVLDCIKLAKDELLDMR